MWIHKLKIPWNMLILNNKIFLENKDNNLRQM